MIIRHWQVMAVRNLRTIALPLTNNVRRELFRDGEEFKLARSPEPLLRWTDPTRKDTQIKDAAIWAWGLRGRPAVLLTQESYGGKWAYELVSASTDRIALIMDSGC